MTETSSGRPETAAEDGPGRPQVDPERPVREPLWTPADYGPVIAKSGAEKLRSSAVAPLTALARGCYTLDNDHEFVTFCEAWHISRRRAQGRRLAEEVRTGDILVMPWYLPDNVVRADRSGKDLHPSSIQYRPQIPAVGPDGRELKYEIVYGHDSIIGAHPATPADWFDSDRPIVLAEGQLKADSVLTALLLAGGVDPADLAAPPTTERDETVTASRKRLHELLADLPKDLQLLVMSNVGVYNWRKNPEWTTFRLTGRSVKVAVDGDVAHNHQVHQAVTGLWEFLTRSDATPTLLSPVDPTGLDHKIGVDDFLARHGDWTDLTGLEAATLPPAPPRGDADRVGESRISRPGTMLETCEPMKDDAGTTIGGRWRPVLPLGGRIAAIFYVREPTDRERQTGIFGDGVIDIDGGSVDTGIEVEVSWDTDDTRVTVPVTGPASFLNYPPAQWHRNGALLPAELLRQPAWPPTGRLGEDWLSAIKAHRADEQIDRVRWNRQGWVPVLGDLPVFVIGQQVAGPSGPHTDTVTDTVSTAVTDDVFPNASRFGVGELDSTPFDDPEYRDRLRADITAVLEVFGHAWTNPGYAAVVIGAALRPVIPLRPVTTVWMVGTAGSGKSWTAAAAMAFWAEFPGAWNPNSLPGSAKDTFAATENAIGHAVIWTVDDLAPSANTRKVADEEAAIEDINRAVFNGKGRGRMTKDQTARPTIRPYCVLIATAENEPSAESIKQRSVILPFAAGALPADRAPTDDLEHLAEEDGAPARVTQGLIKFLRWQAAQDPDGWQMITEEALTGLEMARDDIVARLADNGFESHRLTRVATLAADVQLGLTYLRRLGAEVGMSDADLAILDQDLPRGLLSIVSDGQADHETETPGQQAVAAIAALMRSGRAHLTDIEHPRNPPAETLEEASTVSSLLGWTQRNGDWEPRPGSVTIGHVTDRRGRKLILLDPKVAFEEAKKYSPDILPGSSNRQAWRSAMADGLLEDDVLEADPRGGKRPRAQLAIGGRRGRWVPVKVSAILGDIAGADAYTDESTSTVVDLDQRRLLGSRDSQDELRADPAD